VGLRIGRNLLQDIALSIVSKILLLMEDGYLSHFRFDRHKKSAGAEVSRVAVLQKEAKALKVGDRVNISVKSFNPEVNKLLSD
jgi:hypothetical protein